MTHKTQQRILLVDDDARDRGMIKLLLSRLPEAPYSCIEAENCDTALELCRKQHPDCILLDYSMPDMDGIIFLKKLRHEGFRFLPVILVTAFGTETLAVHALKTGVQDYLRKDKLSPEVLSHAIKFAIYQKQAEKTLLQRELDLQAKNDELLRFSNMITSDLKIPLVAIRASVGRLEQNMAGGSTESLMQDIAYINAAAEKMSTLLEELLQLSRFSSVVNASAETPLQEIVHESLIMLGGRIKKSGVRVKISQEPVLFYGDRKRLMEVLQNLIDNALNLMGDQERPTIEIGAETLHGDTVFFVRDNGMGIDPRHKDKLFSLLEKHGPHSQGSGMGPALVKRIIELHGGKIWAEPEGPGKGTCIRFTLPVMKFEV